MNFHLELIPENFTNSLFLIGLYAEAHFRFKIPFSRYFKKEPELIFDTPWRLEPGQVLTVFLVIKDAHSYPAKLKEVEISVRHDDEEIYSHVWEMDHFINDRQKELEFELKQCILPEGEIEIMPRLKYIVNDKERWMEVDNYSLISKPPLRVTHSKEALPVLEGWLQGDTHLHSSLTNDQVEFGASLEVNRKAAELMGLSFITATDHSYDLDDEPEDYLKNDPALIKWSNSREAIARMNQNSELTILPGEEVSISNSRGENVHLLHFNDSKYFPGAGDSGEDWKNFHSQLNATDVFAQRSPDTVSVAAHSAYQFPWLARLLLNRGHWEKTDHEISGLDGVQIICGTPATSSFQDSRNSWIEALLSGYKLGVYGGSDGHGNFNRNWHVKLPVWSLGFHDDQIFGQSRTLLRSKRSGLNDLINAMKLKRTALSTGPIGEILLKSEKQIAEIGDTLSISSHEKLEITLRGLSSSEFGKEMDVTLYAGNLDDKQEVIVYHEVDQWGQFELHLPFSTEAAGYLRLEITSEGSRWPGVYVSSPIWIEIS